MSQVSKLFLLTLAALVFATGAAGAQSRGRLLLCSDPACSVPPTSGQSTGLISLSLRLDPVTPIKTVSFSIETPACLNGAVVAFSSPFAASGSAQTGIELDLGSCQSTAMTLGTVLIVANTPISTCCAVVVRPHSSSPSGRPEGKDCANETVLLSGWGATVHYVENVCEGAPTTPYAPIPADGATVDPDGVILDWDSAPTTGTGLGEFAMMVIGGTDPLHLDSWMDPYPVYSFDPGPLSPGTTYYWRVNSIVTDFGSTLGPIWSFTTSGVTPTRQSTWGSIKALYR